MRKSEKCCNNIKRNNNNFDIPLTSRRIDGGKKPTTVGQNICTNILGFLVDRTAPVYTPGCKGGTPAWLAWHCPRQVVRLI